MSSPAAYIIAGSSAIPLLQQGQTAFMPSGSTLELVQGGTVNAPNAFEFPLLTQPVDTNKAPFGLGLSAGKFNSTFDNVMHYGYNPQAISGGAGQWQCVLSIEQDYEGSPGVHFVEMYWALADQVGTFGSAFSQCRPFGMQWNRTNATVTTAINTWGNGTLAISDTNTNYCSFAPTVLSFVPANYAIQGANGLVVSAAAGQVSASALNGTLALQSAGASGGNINVLSTNTNFYDSGGTVRSVLTSTSANKTVFTPNVDSTGSIGTAALRWSLIRGLTVTSGDLDLRDEDRVAHWTLREEADCIIAVNRVTDEWFKLPLVPLTKEEKKRYGKTKLNTKPVCRKRRKVERRRK